MADETPDSVQNFYDKQDAFERSYAEGNFIAEKGLVEAKETAGDDDYLFNPDNVTEDDIDEIVEAYSDSVSASIGEKGADISGVDDDEFRDALEGGITVQRSTIANYFDQAVEQGNPEALRVSNILDSELVEDDYELMRQLRSGRRNRAIQDVSGEDIVSHTNLDEEYGVGGDAFTGQNRQLKAPVLTTFRDDEGQLEQLLRRTGLYEN